MRPNERLMAQQDIGVLQLHLALKRAAWPDFRRDVKQVYAVLNLAQRLIGA
jgi:hypothetical protein